MVQHVDICLREQIKTNVLLRCCYLASVNVKGMRCPECAKAIRWSLLDVAGILRAEVSFEQSAAAVLYDPLHVCPHMIDDVIRESAFDGEGGYEATVVSQKRLSILVGIGTKKEGVAGANEE